MDEDALRQLVRDAVTRHLQQHTTTGADPAPAWKAHTSHGRFTLTPSPDGTCIVEPAVRCNHCGYCQSMGH